MKRSNPHCKNLSLSILKGFRNGRVVWNKDFKNAACQNCSVKFMAPQWKIRRGKKKFCSKRCYLFFNRPKTKILNCKKCYKEFVVKQHESNRGRGKFCSYFCAQKFMKKENHPCWKGRKNKKCQICKINCPLPLGRLKTRVTCSKACYKIHLSKKLSGNYTHLWNHGKSREPYPLEFNNFLKNRIRNRDKRCRICGVIPKRKLDVHHIDYNKNNLSEKKLISLCGSCHRKTNHNRKHWIKLFKKIMF